MTTKEPLALEYDMITPAYADQLTRIERHGPVSHLIFCPSQNQDWDGKMQRVAIVGCRVIVQLRCSPGWRANSAPQRQRRLIWK
jgi:hypothetical protein